MEGDTVMPLWILIPLYSLFSAWFFLKVVVPRVEIGERDQSWRRKYSLYFFSLAHSVSACPHDTGVVTVGLCLGPLFPGFQYS